MSDKPVLIRYDDGPLRGAEYEIASAELAAKAHPHATIVSYIDGSPLEPAAPVAPALSVPQPAGTV